MTPRLTVLPGDAPDDIDLDLLELGAVPAPHDRARIEAARSGPLSEAHAELAEARALFARQAPPLRPERRTPWSRTAWRLAPGVALAAAALLVVGLLSGSPSDDGVRPMGGLVVELDVVRDGADVDAGSFVADDELLVHLRSPHGGYLDVWTRQADGAISPLVVGQPVQRGERVTLPGAVRLDRYAGREWLLFRVTDTPSAPQNLADLLPSDLEPGRSHAIEVTRQR